MSKQIIHINSVEDERILHYLSMRDNILDTSGNRLFVAEGEKVVVKLLKSKLHIHSILAKNTFYEKYNGLIENCEHVKLMTADIEILKLIIGFRMHTGVMAVAQKPENIVIDDLSDRIVCLNGIIDSENVGSIIRNSTAFGIDSIIFDKSTSSPFLRRAVRVSMGTVFNSKVYNSEILLSDLIILKEKGYQIISAEIAVGSISVNDFIFPKKFVLIFGNESKGIRNEIIDCSDDIKHIPIGTAVESLNVASSSAVILSRI